MRRGNVKLCGLSPGLVANFVRIMWGANLQIISDLLCARKQWAFSFAGDGSTKNGVSLFVIRIGVIIGVNLKNIHLLLVPFYQRHTAANINALLFAIFDALRVTWRDTLLGVSTDGENTITGRHGGLATLLEAEAANLLLRIWCPPHQIDLVVKGATLEADDGDIYETTHAFSVHLRMQLNLITAMGVSCPRDTTRWLGQGKMLKFFVDNRRHLLEHLENRPTRAPSIL